MIEMKYSEELMEAIRTNQFKHSALALTELSSLTQVKTFVKALQSNTTLIELDLSQNEIEKEGIQALADVIKINTTLTRLDFPYDITRFKIGGQVAIKLEEIIKLNTTLTNLTLKNQGLGPREAKDIAKALEINKSLNKLSLGLNKIGDEGAEALAAVLKDNTTLNSLYLGANKIEFKGAQALAEVLKTNATLRKIDFSHNQIGVEGVEALAEALKINKTLTKLDIRWNRIGEERAKALVNNTLTEMNCSLGDKELEIIKEGLKINKLLAECNPLSEEFQKYKALLQNEEALKGYHYAEKLDKIISEVEITAKVLGNYEPRLMYEIESKEGAELSIKPYQELDKCYDANYQLKVNESGWGKDTKFSKEDVATLKLHRDHPEYQKTGGYIRKLLSMSIEELQVKLPADSEGWKILFLLKEELSKEEKKLMLGAGSITKGLEDLFSAVAFEGAEEQSLNSAQLEEGWKLLDLIKVPERKEEKAQGSERVVVNNENDAQGSSLIGEVASSNSMNADSNDFASH